MQTLMLALGFVTTRGMDGSRVKWGAPCHRIRLLNAATGMRFAEQIGFMSERKNQALIEADHPQAARYDHIPIGRELLDELAPENDALRKTMLMSLARRGAVSRRSATTLLERTPSVELEQLLGYFYDEVAIDRAARGPADVRPLGARQRDVRGQRVRQPQHDLVPHGLRHDRRRARLLTREVQGARRRRPDDDRQPDDPDGAAHARLRRAADRGRSRPTSTSTRRSSARPACCPSTCRSSTSRSASARSRTWATSR